MSLKVQKARKEGFSVVINITNFANIGDKFTIEKQGENILLIKVK